MSDASLDSPATPEFAAGLEFEPWRLEAGDWRPPHNDEWLRKVEGLFPTIRASWLMCQKTKPELVQVARDYGDESAEVLDGMKEAADYLRGLLTIVECAHLRLLVAESALALGGEAAPAGEA